MVRLLVCLVFFAHEKVTYSLLCILLWFFLYLNVMALLLYDALEKADLLLLN